MGIIKLNNIRTFSFHGCMDEEAKIGSDYRVDLIAKGDFTMAAATDDLKYSIDYVILNTIVKEEMSIRSKLLEHVAQRIIDRVLLEITMVEEITVLVSKINPPVGGDVEYVTVEMQGVR
ncbi:dihydroneopterin aldolase [Myroides marinus]|uniref:dihydroneopterin aldolase n=1 Tax=Myroides marinus TaxID=703342 RepID=UPI0025755C82|nr:dihydroneopterin aldolase [Myroides marinus]MDM1367462.1 dihydroneopterin aldolase [Myroides marinus]MDM1370946.1 dihydroneopterin aldolase [Myroides marinus]MDM1373961.1 dihydroneopterin aldolase [Myroides marinus]MDM1382983.1 dihydroneopterin aldolase [Myroides marinus]MDM1388434.1 dihydroneopterin aldolase [Myroides marinus]